MSYTTVKAVWPGDRVEDLEQLQNSHGTAMPVWTGMCAKYLGKPWVPMMLSGEMQALWDLQSRSDIPHQHRAVLMFTFDRAYVIAADFKQFAAAVRQFLIDFPPTTGHVNHWTRIAEIFETMPVDAGALGLQVTSVSEELWCTWDEELDQPGPPEWEKCFDVYAELRDIERVPS